MHGPIYYAPTRFYNFIIPKFLKILDLHLWTQQMVDLEYYENLDPELMHQNSNNYTAILHIAFIINFLNF